MNTQSDAEVRAKAGGTLVNGSAADTDASISAPVGVVFDGPGTITNYGKIQGTGGTAVSLGSSQATLIEESSGILTGALVGGGGSLVFASGQGTSSITGAISGFGSIQVQAGATVALSGTTTTASGSTLTNKGTLSNKGDFILLGQTVNSGTIQNQSAGTIDFQADVSITTDPSTKQGIFNNTGKLQKSEGTGTSIVRTGSAALTDSGTTDVETGILELTGSTVTVSGLVEGAGTIEFGPGAISLMSQQVTVAAMLLAGTGAELTVAQNLTYGGAFSETANTSLSIANTDVFTLNGPATLSKAVIDGPGQLKTAGTTALAGATIENLANWANSGTVTETGQLTLSSKRATDFYNMKGGEFDLANNFGINATTTTHVVNSGLLKKTAGGLSTLAVALVNNGTVEVASGEIDVQGALSGTGKLEIDAGKILQADASVASGQSVYFQGNAGRLNLTDAPEFAGTLSGFGGTNRLDLTQFGAVTSLSFAENAKGTGGTLTIKDGTLEADIALLGQYMPTGFHTVSDGHSGTYVSYTSSAQATTSLAHPATS